MKYRKQFQAWWGPITLQGDPLRRADLVGDAFDGGYESGRRDALKILCEDIESGNYRPSEAAVGKSGGAGEPTAAAHGDDPAPACIAGETDAICPHGMPIAENVCGPCSQGRPNRPAGEAGERPACTCEIDPDMCLIHG